jgi:hypothetical protein
MAVHSRNGRRASAIGDRRFVNHLDESTGDSGITAPGADCPGFTAGGAG